ncbi:nuclear pore assembly and biogenesis domain-containing protein [Purpureocillium lavendulum]|uniref:Nuclear pore assembly and biogenesis domain-containing protein n=1 Tax=Purpureocillium lavendulum TaxID=1247861 RepID=A0AB34G4D9_9HYPO|nr:nuclear pore assembly and biogenesis domain-containing protein [Purpureocillium lavendulum]
MEEKFEEVEAHQDTLQMGAKYAAAHRRDATAVSVPEGCQTAAAVVTSTTTVDITVYIRPTAPAEQQPLPTEPFRPDTTPVAVQPLPTEPFHPDQPAPPPPVVPTEEPCEDDEVEDEEEAGDGNGGGIDIDIADGDPLIDLNVGDSIKVSA